MRALSFLIFATTLAGCDRVAADRADAQLVARVNGSEISARHLGMRGGTGAAPTVAQAVEKGSDRELLVPKAPEAGPERGPPVQAPTDSAARAGPAQGEPAGRA